MPDILPGQTTLATLRQLVADETDQPTPTPFTNVTIDTYNRWLNRSQRELIGLMVDLFEDYFINPDTGNPFFITTDGTNYLYNLPNDCWKVLGVDCYWQPGNIQSAVTMRRFQKLERNKWQWYANTGVMVPQYKITGSQLWLIPQPPANGLQLLVRYVPIIPDMVDSGTITISGMVAGDSIAIASQTSVPQGPPVAGAFPALTPQIQYVSIPAATVPIDTPTRVEFNVGSTDVETASNLAEAMNRPALLASPVPWSTGSQAQDANVATVTVSGTVVTITLVQALAIVWSSASAADATLPANGVALAPLPKATQWNPYGAWLNFGTILNGWDELVVVDTAIKIMGKQQQGTELLEKRKAELWLRIRTEANNRNAAENGRIANTLRLRGRRWGGGGGFGGN